MIRSRSRSAGMLPEQGPRWKVCRCPAASTTWPDAAINLPMRPLPSSPPARQRVVESANKLLVEVWFKGSSMYWTRWMRSTSMRC